MTRRRLLGFAVGISLVVLVITWGVYLTSVGTSRLLFSGGNTSFYLRDQHLQVYRWDANKASALLDISVFVPLITCGLLWLCWVLYLARRHWFTIGAAASLLISVGLLAEWMRQYDYAYDNGLIWTIEVPKTTRVGSLNFGLFTCAISPEVRKGFAAPGAPLYLVVYIPYWTESLCFMIAPAMWLFRYRRRRSQTWRGCNVCSYNLTANESGICPECGTPIYMNRTPTTASKLAGYTQNRPARFYENPA